MLVELARKLAAAVKPIDDIAATVEAILLALVVRLATWGASIPNVVLVAQSAQMLFVLSFSWGLVIAISLELLGHGFIEQWQSTKHWNATKRKSDPPANVGLALVIVIVYFVVDLLMVGALSYAKYQDTENWQSFITLAYPVIGIASAICGDGRSRLFRLRQAVAMERQEAAEARQERKRERQEAAAIAAETASVPEPVAEVPAREAARAIVAANPGITGRELATMTGRSARTCRNYIREFAAETASGGNGRH